MRVLISGASITGPVLAYWLDRYGFDVTVVERAPELRKTGGHAVDLFGPAMEISEKMGVLAALQELATGTTLMSVRREGGKHTAKIDATKLLGTLTDRHIEIMRDDLSEVYYKAGRERVEYLFGDSITAISDDGDVTFERTQPRKFDLIVGADGLHSNVRRLTFGEEAGLTKFLGAYLAVFSVPKSVAVEGDSIGFSGPGRMAMVYTARHLDDARAVFVFRSPTELGYDHRDVEGQKVLLRNAIGGMDPQVDGWLTELDTSAHPVRFYFDAITQLQLESWSRGRVTLAGDAGYCPGPGVGGSTSLAVYGAYVLAGELAQAGGDHRVAFPAYEQIMLAPVLRSRAFAQRVAKTIVPSSTAGVLALMAGGRLISVLPSAITKRLAKLNESGVRMHDAMHVPDYQAIAKTG